MTGLNVDPFVIGRIDYTRRFVSEHLSPLPHTEVFHELSPATRLRYNQLVASCYHEHFIYLERMLAGLILPALIRGCSDASMTLRLLQFQQEERKHTAWFHRLHVASEPALYGENLHYFVRVAPPFQRLLEAFARRPARFPFCLWIAMIIEERTIPAAKEMLREGDELEPHYVKLHRLHAADEAGHVSCDAEMLQRLWPALSPVGRAFNRLLFVTLLREFFQLPKRAGWRVVMQLAAERPELVPLLPRIRHQLLALGRNRAYLATLYSRRREPRTFALADRFAELRHLESRLLGSKTPAV